MLFAVLACALALPPLATAIEFEVDSTADEVDAAPGDESCLTAGGHCTLRAAIEEGDSVGEFTGIDFKEEAFEGRAADTIALGSALPAITVPGFVNGRTCATAAGVEGPCVGIDGSSTEPALTVNAEELEIWGLAITGAGTAVEVVGAPRAKVQASWFGVGLDGAVAGNGTGVLVGPGSNRSLIGGEGPGFGNVFAGSGADGLDVHGGNEVRVFGNRFGVEPDGAAPAANGGDAIEVASTGAGVTGTKIGTRVSSAAASSPLCDGGCNLISGAGAHGIDLQGDGGSEGPAESTFVLGNYIGVDAAGAAAIPNAGAGVRVGEAPDTLVGGPSSGEANRINGGSAAVQAGPAAANLAVRGNSIGVGADGESLLAPPQDGIVVDSAELPSPAAEAEIAGNEIGMEDGVAISQRGEGAWIVGNRIAGSEVGVKTFESAVEHGNVIEGNSIEGPAANGILLETSFNEVAGNEVHGAGAAGIRVNGLSLPFGVTGNLVGGDAAGDENVLDDSGGAAVEISNLEETDNEVARNRGAGNAGPFIDLVAASPGTEVGPNRGLEPPAISEATQTAAGGGAVKGARVRVFLKRFAAPGELESFLGETIADGVGGWHLAYGTAIPAGSIVAATQTKEGATSELAVATIPGGSVGAVAGGESGSFGPGASGSLADAIARIRPQTKIVRTRARRHSIRFVFESDQVGSKFLCRLDGKPFDLCGSPKGYAGLTPGRHTFWVRTVDSNGRVDLSPAKKKFTVPG